MTAVDVLRVMAAGPTRPLLGDFAHLSPALVGKVVLTRELKAKGGAGGFLLS